MDLDDMKNTWSELNDELARKQKLSDAHILQMTQRKSSSRLNRLVYFELFGTLISLMMFVYLLFNFHRLDNWLTLTGGAYLIFILLLSFGMTFTLIKKIKRVNILTTSYHQTVLDFTSLKKTLGLYKRFSIVINIISPFMILPVASKLFFDKNILADLDGFWEGIAASFIILPIILFSLIYFYRFNIRKVGKTLKEYGDQMAHKEEKN